MKTDAMFIHQAMVSLKILAFLLMIIFINGCKERSIDPFESEAGMFSVYATLDLDENPNYIRIRNINDHFLFDPSIGLRADVSLENLENGSIQSLKDTIVAFSGNPTFNYIIDTPLKPRTSYKVIIEGDNGVTVTSIATTPGVTEVHLSENEDVRCNVSIDFVFKNVHYPESIRMEVGFLYQNRMFWAETGEVAKLQYNMARDEMRVRMNTINLLAEVWPPPPEQRINVPPLFWVPEVLCDELDSNVVSFRYVHFGPEWQAVRPIWSVNPFDVKDIENGIGFFGAVKRGTFTYRFTLD